LKIKLKGPHLDTVEATEAESQAVLNTPTEHDFQDALKNCRNARNSAYSMKETTSKVMVASRPKLVFGQMAAPVHGWLFMYHPHAHNYPKLTHDVVLPSLPQGII
jgi:hypothetical protein